MGIYLNPGNENFKMALNSKIYVDKSALISYTNSVLKTEQRFVCVSRPRRFGKSMTANMLCAYYGKNVDSDPLFQKLSISSCESYRKCLNQYNVIFLNMQTFLGRTESISEMITLIRRSRRRDFRNDNAHPEISSSRSAEGLSGC